ncbi:hypothetical protein EVAR_8642_1 [Eumeta japonica]|uniref:Uncharacterized protein n=1 Tax=Eumeta variegata TaxID=151549 RepID=A0A4C1TUE8_EUMVA|nr:hypothetical protein EVAR_8642_1 [Eumeta japonica]
MESPYRLLCPVSFVPLSRHTLSQSFHFRTTGPDLRPAMLARCGSWAADDRHYRCNDKVPGRRLNVHSEAPSVWFTLTRPGNSLVDPLVVGIESITFRFEDDGLEH